MIHCWPSMLACGRQSCWLESPEVTRVALESLFSATRDSTRTLRYDLRLDSTWQPVTRDLTTYMARVTNINYNDYFYVSGSRTSFELCDLFEFKFM